MTLEEVKTEEFRQSVSLGDHLTRSPASADAYVRWPYRDRLSPTPSVTPLVPHPPPPPQDINGVAVSPNDKLLASGSQDRTAKLWSLAGGADLSLLGVFRGHRRGVWAVCFSPVDQVLATSSADGTCKLWSLQDFGCLKVGPGEERGGWRDAKGSYVWQEFFHKSQCHAAGLSEKVPFVMSLGV